MACLSISGSLKNNILKWKWLSWTHLGELSWALPIKSRACVFTRNRNENYSNELTTRMNIYSETETSFLGWPLIDWTLFDFGAIWTERCKFFATLILILSWKEQLTRIKLKIYLFQKNLLTEKFGARIVYIAFQNSLSFAKLLSLQMSYHFSFEFSLWQKLVLLFLKLFGFSFHVWSDLLWSDFLC